MALNPHFFPDGEERQFTPSVGHLQYKALRLNLTALGNGDQASFQPQLALTGVGLTGKHQKSRDRDSRRVLVPHPQVFLG